MKRLLIGAIFSAIILISLHAFLPTQAKAIEIKNQEKEINKLYEKIKEKIQQTIGNFELPGLDVIAVILLIIFVVLGAIAGIIFGIASAIEAIAAAVVTFLTGIVTKTVIGTIIVGALAVIASFIHTIISALNDGAEGLNELINTIIENLQNIIVN